MHRHNLEIRDTNGAKMFLTIQVQRLPEEDMMLFEEKPMLRRLEVRACLDSHNVAVQCFV